MSQHIHVEVRQLTPSKFGDQIQVTRINIKDHYPSSHWFFTFLVLPFFFLLKTGSHYCCHGQPETSYIDHVGLELVAILPPECWHYSHPVHSRLNKLFFFF